MFISYLDKLDSGSVQQAGGKGASLGELINAGLQVPKGFVVATDSFDEFLKETDLIQEIRSELNGIDTNSVHTIERASENIQALIKSKEIPQTIADAITNTFTEMEMKYVAVRSSATAEDGKEHAWAGQLESYLNVKEDKLLESVKKCWASLFTPRAIFYRFEKDLQKANVSVGVVVQEMVQSEMAGIAFSVHPITKDENQIIIEAGLGLGEAIVSGEVTPDSYVVSKKDLEIIDVNVNFQNKTLNRNDSGGNEWSELGDRGKEQVLSESQIKELSEVIKKIEGHYGAPQDIEWAFQGGEFYITQSRPITTLNQKKSSKKQEGYNPDDYLRMFAGKAFSYFLTDIFLGHYGSFGVLSVQDSESWMSFIPKMTEEETLKEGKELYTDEEKYKKYRKDFNDYKKESITYFDGVLAKENISVDEAEKFFKYAEQHFFYYSKTEFFYTDLLKEEEMVLTVKEFDELKLQGREHLNKIIFEEHGFLKVLLKKISEQTGCSKEKLYQYSRDEILTLLNNGKTVSDSVILERDKALFISEKTALFGNDAEQTVQSFFATYRERSDIIYGTTANSGKVVAKARVLIPDFNDFSKIHKEVEEMKKGEVLIAETTSPEIIKACKKASAIITNQGGILSHAAIISRELDIPCIVGTDKDVILNIKTGDDLEVDADNGVLKILK